MTTAPLSPATLKILMNDWQALREIIAEIACTRKQRHASEHKSSTAFLTLLSDTDVHNAFYGPYHSLIQILSNSYGLISKIRTHLIITQDENIKPHLQNPSIDLPQTIKKDINVAALDKLQRQIDQLAHEQFAKWQELVEQWRQQIVMQLTLNEINLSDLEIEDLTHPETLTEMVDRFTDLSLTLPKIKNTRYDFKEFFQCKAILVLHSCYNRQHKTPSLEEIQKQLKILKGDFKQIAKQQDELTKQLEKETQILMKTIYS